MERVTCTYCGIPFRAPRIQPGRDHFCCTGCAMLSRVPVDDKGQFPVNAHLITALGAGFLFFNQLLFWLVAVLLVREARMEVALRFFWLAGGAALGVWLTLAALHWKEKAARTTDFVVMALGMVALGVAFRRLPPIPFEMVVTNLLLILWSFRGLLRPGSKKQSAAGKDS